MKKIALNLLAIVAVANAGVFKLDTIKNSKDRTLSVDDIHVTIYRDAEDKNCYVNTYFFETANSIKVLSKTKIDCKKVKLKK